MAWPSRRPARACSRASATSCSATTDASVATLYNAQSGLFRTAVTLGRLARQAAALDPRIRSFELKGCLRAHRARARLRHRRRARHDGAPRRRRLGDRRREALDRRGRDRPTCWPSSRATSMTAQVKAFLVPTDAAGVALETIRGKVSLRPMQNAVITARRRARGRGSPASSAWSRWRDVAADACAPCARTSRGSRPGSRPARSRRHALRQRATAVRPAARRLPAGAGEARPDARQRHRVARDGRPAVDAAGPPASCADENSALAKMQTALLARETVALAREVVGGNGILLEHDVARFFADAEAVYSYEGTHEINALIVGRALTGSSAFA